MNYKQSLSSIQSKLDRSLNIEERIELINELMSDSYQVTDEFEEIIDYISSDYFRIQNRYKNGSSVRYEETYLANGLSIVSDYLLDKWDEFESRNRELEEYTVQSHYDIQRLRKAGEKKQIIGFNTQVIDDYYDDIPSSVIEGWELHVDYLENYTKHANDIFKISEEEKRKLRKYIVENSLDTYPELMERYIVYKELGLKYGFDESLSHDDKERIKNNWLEAFSQDANNKLSPKARYYRIQKMYNEIGYELYKMQQLLSKPVKPSKKKQSNQSDWLIEQQASDFILEMVDLSDPAHVNGLLTIQKGKNVGEYYPIWMMLEEKHKNNIDSEFHILREKIMNVLEVADLHETERDIVEIVLDKHHDLRLFSFDYKGDLYKRIVEYINHKYGLNKKKNDVIRMIKYKISPLLADTYNQLMNGAKSKKCRKCRMDKLPNSFGRDSRNKNGVKSICKKCDAKMKKKIRDIS